MKSSRLQLRPNGKVDQMDRLLNQISTNQITWNANAAFLAVGAAVAQVIVFLIAMPSR
jgi:hypothetical protein